MYPIWRISSSITDENRDRYEQLGSVGKTRIRPGYCFGQRAARHNKAEGEGSESRPDSGANPAIRGTQAGVEDSPESNECIRGRYGFPAFRVLNP